jgi:NADPH:quinone reductase-like Zn-dependent oxidoreductase
MKAAVLHRCGESPRYEDFPDPTPQEGQVLVHVRAVALENIDKMMADGSHFASQQFLSTLPAIVGFDGVGMLGDGRLVGFGGMQAPYGAMAEKAVIPQDYHAPVPDGVDALTAAALPASALTSYFPLKWGAKLQAGETVLINGATGVSGRLAVQVAKLLGAGRVIGTGRNPESLKRIQELGADATIDLKQSDQEVMDEIQKQASDGYDIILDFLWGRPTELLIQTLIPHELKISKPVRLIQIGEKAGRSISLPAEAL